jgi:hypothetical protein
VHAALPAAVPAVMWRAAAAATGGVAGGNPGQRLLLCC